MARIDSFLQLGRQQGCSDIHFTIGLPPLVRLDGELVPLKYRVLAATETQDLLTEILDPPALQVLDRMGSVDLCYSPEGLGRFRLNIFRQRRGLSAICRIVPERVPSLSELGLPGVLSHFATLNSGLVLITGGPGTGKTTTLAALIKEISENRDISIVTLEDPVEYLHQSARSLVIQRQVGDQVRSFHEGLRSALRQDPDVILIGELRDPDTIMSAIEASETGHLVFGTLHTRGAFQTIHRIVDSFASEAQGQVRHTLADNLRAVVTQDLVRAADGRGRRAVAEILVMTPAIAQHIREGKTHQIPSAMATGRRLGMQLMDQSLLSLVQSGDIDPNEAFLKASDKKEFIFYVTQTQLLETIDPTASAATTAGDSHV